MHGVRKIVTTVLAELLSALPDEVTLEGASGLLNVPTNETVSLLENGSLVGELHLGQWLIQKQDLLEFLLCHGNHLFLNSGSASQPAVAPGELHLDPPLRFR